MNLDKTVVACHHGSPQSFCEAFLACLGASEADQCYEAAVTDWLFETPACNDAVLALVEFAGVIAADRLMGEVTRDPVNDERDAFHQVIALAAAGGWLTTSSGASGWSGSSARRERRCRRI